MFTKADIERYFLAEKQESIFLLGAGLLAIVLSATFYLLLKKQFYKGAAVPLIALGLLQAIAGMSILAGSDRLRVDGVYAYDMNPRKLTTQEWPRMIAVNRRLAVFRWMAAAFAVVGCGQLVWQLARAQNSYWAGFGILLLIESACLMVFIEPAEKRAGIYQSQLEHFEKR